MSSNAAGLPRAACRQTTRSPEPDLVLGRLSERFPVPDKPRLAPLDELVLTILSQSTTDENRDRAWRTLAARYPAEDVGGAAGGASPTGPISWESVLRATPAELEDAVRVAGLANQKAPAIHAALQRLRDEVGRITLDHLEEMGDEEAIAYLTTFRGVGVKTAACVLCFSLRRPVLPVDTHVLRIARRLAWVPPRASADLTYTTLSRTVSPSERFRMHMLLITFGRSLCLARAPRCGECPLEPECPRIGV
ncbi:MAG: endonuclease III [Gemmatimonadales bacterium]|nr:endonuclease III [Candidatus Palauibacter irciniicola]MYC17998.1 endonuclease III [Gemmatimonadales bacterium]